MRVWIDMSNSPHPLLFAPVARELEARGAEVLVTVRDHAQTLPLTSERWPRATLLGSASPGGRSAKLRAIRGRIGECLRWARGARPDVALSHNSYAQLVAARLAGIPAVTAMDYEHQPANHLGFRTAGRVLLPEALPTRVVRRQGASPGKVVRYPGLKEQLYLADFTPQADVLASLGIVRRDGEAVVLARSAPAGAAYHPNENPLFAAALGELSRQDGIRCVVLARHRHQRAEIERLGLPDTVVPDRAVDGRSLLCEADLFLGAGGTMTREAALLGVPTLSMFAGRPAAVDSWLERRGALRRFERLDQLAGVRPRRDRAADLTRLRAAAGPIRDAFVITTEVAAGATMPR